MYGTKIKVVGPKNLRKIDKPIIILRAAQYSNEIKKDIFTGSLSGEPTFSKGKVRAVKNWCSENNLKIEESIFYSDSINDLPMLESCGIPIVVNPDDNLKKIALDRSYKILNR